MDTSDAATWLDDRAAHGLFSGVAAVWVDGEQVFSHAAGLAHRGLNVPMATDHRFRVASITKMITATAVLRLVERGAFTLDTPVTEWLDADHLPTAATDHMTRTDA